MLFVFLGLKDETKNRDSLVNIVSRLWATQVVFNRGYAKTS